MYVIVCLVERLDDQRFVFQEREVEALIERVTGSWDTAQITPPLPLANVRLDLALVLRDDLLVRLQLLGRQTPGVQREPIEEVRRKVRNRQVEVVTVHRLGDFQTIRALLGVEPLPRSPRCVLKRLGPRELLTAEPRNRRDLVDPNELLGSREVVVEPVAATFRGPFLVDLGRRLERDVRVHERTAADPTGRKGVDIR